MKLDRNTLKKLIVETLEEAPTEEKHKTSLDEMIANLEKTLEFLKSQKEMGAKEVPLGGGDEVSHIKPV